MLEVKHVSYAYDETTKALQDVSITVEDGEILCLLGPSGCGKSTLLRVIAGLETGYSGDVLLKGQDMRDIPVHERDFGFMFQDFALFPHMTVEGNVAYGLKRKDLEKKEIQTRVADVLENVGLTGFTERDVNMLSGGQKQRVALARSLAPNPRLLMLDEPLGSLDALLRDQLIVELRNIIKSLGLTAVYVTHDQKEAYAIADRLAVMNRGHIEQVDTPRRIYYQPKTEFVARFLGLSNIFPITADPMIQSLIASSDKAFASARSMLIHPSGIHIVDETEEEQNQLQGKIEQIVFRGDVYQVTMRLSDNKLLEWMTQSIEFEVGEDVAVRIGSGCVTPLA